MMRLRRPRQRGVAILAAMLTVTLVASFAAAAMWQQWRSVEVEAAERDRVQAGWILTGALDWARLILREDGRTVDHLSEPWAVPLQEARLSTFLSADRSGSTDASLVDHVFLSGRITDLQSLLNAGGLAERGSVNETQLACFQRLFALLGLPQAQLEALVENLRFASDISTDNKSAAQAPLAPQRVDDLAWLGLPASTVAALRPYVTVLPVSNARINLNTASAHVLSAAVEGLSLADAQRLVAARDQSHFRQLADAGDVLGDRDRFTTGTNADRLSVSSNYFEVHGSLRMDAAALHERSVVQRNGSDIVVLQRERIAASAADLLAQAARR